MLRSTLDKKKRFYEEQLDNIRIHLTSSSVEVGEISKLLEYLSISADGEITAKDGDYTLSEQRLQIFTGLTWKIRI